TRMIWESLSAVSVKSELGWSAFDFATAGTVFAGGRSAQRFSITNGLLLIPEAQGDGSDWARATGKKNTEPNRIEGNNRRAAFMLVSSPCEVKRKKNSTSGIFIIPRSGISWNFHNPHRIEIDSTLP